MKNILDELNPNQLRAVEHINGSLLILAIAGSGKTKTITTRLAYLINEYDVNPKNTLTLTFTNKAASQMRKRALELINVENSSVPLLCTFHKFGLLFLKRYMERIGRNIDFIIIDSDDKYKLIKSIVKRLKIDIDISFVSSEISKYKNSLLLPEDAVRRAELKEYKETALIYVEYQEIIIKDNLVDFDDLLLLPYQILSEDIELREEMSRRYKYIMVDEYQDTNELQVRLLEYLSSEHNNLYVVGDDDQSIYGWRGANIRNILEFSQNFDDAKVIRLETNYRSTQPILDIANSLIEHNVDRLDKSMLSHLGSGPAVKLEHYVDEAHEALSIAKEIKKLLNEGVEPQSIAVLYRVNALSRTIEDGFRREGLKFKLIDGVPFYERAEVKDIISYLRVLSNPCDDFSFMRIVNKPKRGIGKATIEKLKKEALRVNLSIYKSIERLSLDELNLLVGKKVSGSLLTLIKNIKLLKRKSQLSLDGFIELFEKKTNLKLYYENLEDGFDRVSNMNEFYAYFNESVEFNPSLKLEDLLNDIALYSEQDREQSNIIPIMSIHASKGLEFEYVFIIGLEEGFFPLLGAGCNIEEERRLGYVAITRAKRYLTMSYVDSRFYKGRRKVMEKSRFLGEAGLIKSGLKHIKSSPYKKGDLVKHTKFGMGRVQSVNKAGKNYNLLINFGGDKKNILSSFVKSI